MGILGKMKNLHIGGDHGRWAKRQSMDTVHARAGLPLARVVHIREESPAG